MVHTKGSRFGVISGRTVRRTGFSYSQLCADQHIVIQSNKSFSRGSQETNDVHLSMNKKNRWQMTDSLVDEVNVPECTVYISQHHMKPGRYRKKVTNFVQVCSQKSGERRWSDVSRADATRAALSDLTEDKVPDIDEDAELGEVPAKRRRRRKGCKKRQTNQDKDIQEEDEEEEEVMVVHCKVYTAPFKHNFQTKPTKGPYTGKSSKTRKGLPGGNVSYFQGMYEDEVWDEDEDTMLREAVENSLDDVRSMEEMGCTVQDGSLGDFILPPPKSSPKSQGKKGYDTKRVTWDISYQEEKDHIFYVDKEECAIPLSCQSSSYVRKPRGWDELSREQEKDEQEKDERRADESNEVHSTPDGDQPSFVASIGCDDVKDLKAAALRCFDCPTFLWGKCLPPRLVIDITPYIHAKLRRRGFVNTIRAMVEMKKECWILVERTGKVLVERTGKEPQQQQQEEVLVERTGKVLVERTGKEPQQQQEVTGSQHSTDKANHTIRLTLVGLRRNVKREMRTRAHLNSLPFGNTEEVMKILRDHIDHLPFTGLVSASFLTAEPNFKMAVLGEFWEWKQETKTPRQLMNQLKVEYSCHGNTIPEDHFLKPIDDLVTECGICMETDLSGPDGIAMDTTTLTDCQHWFCNNCWRNYLEAGISRGEARLTCPAFDCKTNVDEITLVSLVPASSYQLFKEQQLEVLGVSHRLIKCPRRACGHLLPKIPEVAGATQSSAGLLCACGHVLCGGCRKGLHWPSTCEQNEMYREHSRKRVEFLKGCIVRRANIRRCPACSRPLEKFEGCNYVVCRCSCAFCWGCRTELKSHSSWHSCKPNYPQEVVFVDVLRVKNYFDRALFHQKKGCRTAADLRRMQVNNLLSKLIPVIRRSPWLPSQLPTKRKPSNLLVLDRTISVPILSQVLQDAVDICNEVEFVLEHLEIFLSSSSILNQSTRKLVTEIKGRLVYTSNQIQKILEQKSHYDLLAIPERLQYLSTLGRKNLYDLAFTLK